MHWEIYSILYGIVKAPSFMRFEVADFNRSLKKDMKKKILYKREKLKLQGVNQNEHLKS